MYLNLKENVKFFSIIAAFCLFSFFILKYLGTLENSVDYIKISRMAFYALNCVAFAYIYKKKIRMQIFAAIAVFNGWKIFLPLIPLSVLAENGAALFVMFIAASMLTLHIALRASRSVYYIAVSCALFAFSVMLSDNGSLAVRIAGAALFAISLALLVIRLSYRKRLKQI